jgi:hypothetical protein
MKRWKSKSIIEKKNCKRAKEKKEKQIEDHRINRRKELYLREIIFFVR